MIHAAPRPVLYLESATAADVTFTIVQDSSSTDHDRGTEGGLRRGFASDGTEARTSAQVKLNGFGWKRDGTDERKSSMVSISADRGLLRSVGRQRREGVSVAGGKGREPSREATGHRSKVGVAVDGSVPMMEDGRNGGGRWRSRSWGKVVGVGTVVANEGRIGDSCWWRPATVGTGAGGGGSSRGIGAVIFLLDGEGDEDDGWGGKEDDRVSVGCGGAD